MPDTYRADAKQYAADGNSVTISGLNTGDVVIYRVYASAEENVALTESNADGFSFSEECFHVHRVKWVPSRTANTTYNAMTYRPRMTLPETASITYSGNNLVGGLPFYVGSYVMHVKIPEGDPIYLPGTVDVAFSIQKIPLTICPDANQQKNEGEADPARFTFTSIGLLDGDVVSGILKREPGEEAGNYSFVLTGLSAADYYTPVSYTHLDVYKRQVLRRVRSRHRHSGGADCALPDLHFRAGEHRGRRSASLLLRKRKRPPDAGTVGRKLVAAGEH